jgi:hypothetical protein
VIVIVVCIVPALFVVRHYRERFRKDTNNVV